MTTGNRSSRAVWLIIGVLLACCLLAVIGYVVLRPRGGATRAPATSAAANRAPATQIIASAAATPAAAETATAVAATVAAANPTVECAPVEAPTVTPGAGADWYQLYFTTPQYPDTAANHHGGLDEPLTAFINTAQKSVDIAIYQLDLPDVTQALLDANKRGGARPGSDRR